MSKHLHRFFSNANLVFPKSNDEIEDFELDFERNSKEDNLKNLEKSIDKILLEIEKYNGSKPELSKRDAFFKRMVLACEIVNKCHKEPTFGSVKFQKLEYLCNQISKMALHTNYLKFAAGPFDPKFMYSAKVEFKKQKWYKIEKDNDNKFAKTKFTPLENENSYKKYYDKYFEEDHLEIQQIISIFKKATTTQVELVATVFYCLDNLSQKNQLINNKSLTNSFYDFAPEKEKFPSSKIITAWTWMKENGIVPNP